MLASHLTGEEFLRKFQNEGRMLASLSHTHITQLFDSGISSSGNPYLVMEYVEGEALDRYCDARKLGIEERLRLFLQVCYAVEYAHRNLIVHRDLKPGNILVNAEGVVKLLDFGTASLMADDSPSTVTVTRMLTPRYACPERLRGELAHPAHDVFSLGVILYELLVGAWPYGDPSSMMVELQRAMGESTPIPPSGAITEESARSRSAPLDRLKRAVQGDLSAMTLKAIEDDPGRRYGEVRKLGDDVRNFLEGRPVLARPQTALYRAGKFVRRNWIPVAAAAILAASLSLSAILVLREAQVARQEAVRAQRMADFANNLFVAPNAAWYSGQGGKGKDTKLVDALDAASRRMAAELRSDPETEFRLRTTFARTFLSLMMLDRAGEEAGRAANLLPVVAGKEPTVEVELAIARCELLGRRMMWKEAEAPCHDAVLQARRLGKIPNRLLLQAANDWSTVLQQLGNRRDYEAAVREALAAVPHPSADDMPAVLVVRNNLAIAEVSSGDFAAGASEFRAILAARASLPDTAGESASVLFNLAFCELFLGELANAEKDLRKAVEIAAASPLGNDPRTALVLPLLLTVTLAAEGKSAEGEAELARIKPRMEKFPLVGGSRLFADLAEGILALKQGEAANAEQRFRAALEFTEQQAGGKHYGAAWASRWLASALQAEGRISAARAAADDAVRIWSQIYQDRSAPLLEARAYAAKLSRQLPGVPPVP